MRKLAIVPGLFLWLVASPALAHPMGNFSINVHLGLDFQATGVVANLIVDMAEIPTFQEKGEIDTSGDGLLSPSESSDYASERCGRHSAEIEILLGAVPVALSPNQATVDLLPGAAGLEILRLECQFDLDILGVARGKLTIDNGVFGGRVGWREMTAGAVGYALETDLPVASPSEHLTLFPDGPVADRSRATIAFAIAPGTSTALPSGTFVDRLGSNLQVGWIAFLTASALGATHALAPGHGKTLMAAYLVGRRGRFRHAVGLGLSVAVSHTLGVGLLGLITAVTTSRFRPERIYPWLSIASALVVITIGGVMLYRAVLRPPRDHHPEHDHGHDHSHETNGSGTLGWRSLVALGLAGGLVPSASAVVLLLGAVSTGDPWFGMGLVFAFGIGMAVALVFAGLAAIWAFRLGWRIIGHDGLRHRLEHLVPGLAGGLVTVVGVFLFWQATLAWS